MEDVSGKKILDFSGRMVHNEIYLIEQKQKICCKTHMKGAKSEEKRRPAPDPAVPRFGGMKPFAAEYAEKPPVSAWKRAPCRMAPRVCFCGGGEEIDAFLTKMRPRMEGESPWISCRATRF